MLKGGQLDEYLPIVKVNPQYPRRAQTRGIEGYVLLEYIVTKTELYAIQLLLRQNHQEYLIVRRSTRR